jgi:hypothetical protein
VIIRQADSIYVLAATLRQIMEGNGWHFNESGSGDYFSRPATEGPGDEVLASDGDGGWTHRKHDNDNGIGYMNANEALLAMNKVPQAKVVMNPPSAIRNN